MTVAVDAIVASAEEYARRGWSVIPLRLDKTPAARAWKSAQMKPALADEVAGWFGRVNNIAGVGVVLGAVSGDIFVRDFDSAAAYDIWAASHADLARHLPTCKTHRGYHVYGRFKGTRTAKYADGELRGEGAYVVAPPSPHPAGSSYSWLVPLPDGPVPEIDPWTAGLAKTEPTDELPLVQKREQREQRGRETEREETTEKSRDGEAQAITGGGFDEETAAAIESAIARTLPTKHGKRNDHLFRLARALKAVPALAAIPPTGVISLRPTVVRWHTLALPNILTKDFGVTWGEFGHAWTQVRHAEGDDIMGRVLDAARASAPPAWAADYAPAQQLLAAICRELQRVARDQPFFLSTVKAAELVEVDKATAWRWLKAFCADGALEVHTKGIPGGKLATRYRYTATDVNATVAK